MKNAPQNTAALQQWLQAVITHPAGVQAGLAAAQQNRTQAPVQGAQRVLPSATLTAEERLHIYHSAYFSRLLGCLRSEYPCLQQAIGESVFDQFALAYLNQHPPSTFTLFELSKNFPAFLKANRPPADPNDPLENWPAFLIDLATLERANNEIYNGPGPEQLELLSAQDFLQIPPFALTDLQLKLVPGLRLYTFNFPVQAYFLAFHGKEEAEVPAPKETYLVMSRVGYRVRFWEVKKLQFEFLECLANRATFDQAIEVVAEKQDAFRSVFRNRVRRWVGAWAERGWFLR